MKEHNYNHLINIFSVCFEKEYCTRLIKGDDEPIYLPADEKIPYHRIIFARGFYASALHEIAHWCIAGETRRQQIDFGYWYYPDGRNEQIQNAFEKVEVKPQALEWMFCVAAAFPFNVSCDNLAADFAPDRFAFQCKVYQQVLNYLANGIPARAKRFIQGLQLFYNTPPLVKQNFIYPEEL
ncbi:elongation factor P hydroxylase [Arsenophonus nasoniae]|uniref:Elongation factor P hydroxylase n=1 Tax=Arsenophonus nasoniae TaxID=638 RepID=D2U4C0_9GAMM|nr:elongation factor P hydroxylase [Arsenophonus nasoniae]QBY44107.1 Elongation factor P hydroxylase [Arsenophonus nasoniae]WGL96398.1 elongation factor P hydroxylase [Arsenophonus nasoniae]WGM00479.1 elongation factor P hydroxylase [Arsenophonus nasoniae]WGM04410.1 elongation factor P hydroxylase [Arsenophonus nasoniae]CBA76410.1 conserved hypothetical protein [Arsenophonus nasoniae]